MKIDFMTDQPGKKTIVNCHSDSLDNVKAVNCPSDSLEQPESLNCHSDSLNQYDRGEDLT